MLTAGSCPRSVSYTHLDVYKRQDANVEDRALMVSQGTPETLGKMLVDMGVDGLEKRGKDPATDEIKYCWHYSQATVTDQNSWQVAGEAYIKENYPNWVNVCLLYTSCIQPYVYCNTGWIFKYLLCSNSRMYHHHSSDPETYETW